MIELYIEGRKIDLKDDLEINFNYESIDPDKLSNIKNSFSKTVRIPGTPENNITFGHLFRSDKYIPVAGATNICNDYDPHKKVNWIINKNGVLVNRGYCTLDNIVIESEREIYYNLTLYGGIGEFFYSLSYNDDGSVKNLSDMFWNWYPKTSLVGHGVATTESNEKTKTLMECSAAIVSQAYRGLSPYYQYTGTTEFEKDVVFVPCYCGQYEDFDSKKMLVSTLNQTYLPSVPVMSDATKSRLMNSFPDSILDYSEDPDNPKQYVTLNANLETTGYKYGLASFSRDLDPWEAGDLRVNNLPVAVRLSKLLWTISNPTNNGGYTVEWDEDILNSYQWLYGWITLGKLKQTSEDIEKVTFSPNPTYDGQKTTINVAIDTSTLTGEGTAVSQATPYDLSQNTQTLEKGKWTVSVNVNPSLLVKCADFDYWMARSSQLISGSMRDTGVGGYRYVWTTPVLVHKIYDGSTLIKTIADVFYFSTNTNLYGFGSNGRGASINDIKTTLNGAINLRTMGAGEYIDQFRYHDCKIENPDVTGNYLNTVTYDCGNERISTVINLQNDASQFRVEQTQVIMWTNLSNSTGITAGQYGYDSITFNGIRTTESGTSNSPSGLPVSVEAPYGMVDANNHTIWPYNDFTLSPQQNYSSASFTLNESKLNGVNSYRSTGFNIIKLDKETLFAESDTPMKYLSSFCKMMNYKIVCDNTSKKISIMPLKKYYTDNVVDINNRVDHSRSITVKNISTQSKTINIGLDTPQSYPVTIFDRNSREKFDTVRFDTGIRFNTKETDLLKDIAIKNSIDWQQNSVFYNIHPQFPRAWSLPTVSWTLFDKDASSLDNISSKEFFTLGCPSTTENLVASKDFMPKVAMFDKNDKYVNIPGTLLFLNGFIKNYDYVDVPNSTKVDIQPDSTNPTHYINSSGTVASTQYQDIYIYNFNPNNQYFVTASFTSSYGSYTVNYFNASGTRIGTEYPQAGANLIDAPLTVPAGTATIRCNFRKTDADAKMRVIAPNYVISPRVSLSNDMYEQYYLAGGRCYMYNFKYTDIFAGWGCYSDDQKGTATSWVLPMFNRDLYNYYSEGTQTWSQSQTKLASWNIANQEGLDSIYEFTQNSEFVADPMRNYLKSETDIASVESNEYYIDSLPIDGDDTRIWDNNWNDYIKDIYDRNAREITMYVDLTGLGDPQDIMRKFYAYDGHLFVVQKIENFRLSDITNDKFTKVTLHKINKKSTWTE